MRPTISFILISLLLAGSTLATTVRVPEDAPSIQQGIQMVAAGDTVLVSCGTYDERDISMRSGVVVRSETGEADCVTIDCGGVGAGFRCSAVDNSSVIEGFTITGAYDSGMKLNQANLRISNCALIDNEGLYGGGINCNDSDPIIENCLFRGNRAIGDGAITLLYSSPEIIDCEFRENWSFNEGPGAIWCRFSSPSLLRCSFIDNVSEDAVGAIRAFDGSNLTVTDCTFSGNDGTTGIGAISFSSWDPSVQVVTGCTFHGNAGGPTIWVGMADLTISDTIIAGNDGEAIVVQDSIPTITCTDIYGNVGGDWSEPIADQLGQQGNISADPQFCDAATHDLTLADTSPCAPGSNPGCGLIGAWPVGCGDLTPVEPKDALPARVVLAPCQPNPFNPATTFRYALPRPGAVILEIFDVKGRLVRRLKSGQFEPAGFHSITWRGRDDRGREMGSGVYFYRLQVGDFVASRSMSLIR